MASFLQKSMKRWESGTASMAGDERGKETCDRGWAKLKKSRNYVVASEGKGGLREAPNRCYRSLAF